MLDNETQSVNERLIELLIPDITKPFVRDDIEFFVKLINDSSGEQIRATIKGFRFQGENEEESQKLLRVQEELIRDLPMQLMPKIFFALIKWAFLMMRPHYKSYLSQGVWDLFALAVQYQNAKRTGFVEAIRQTPFSFPSKLTKKQKVINSFFDEKYKPILKRVSKIKRKRWRNDAAQKLALANALPGIPPKRVQKYPTMKASDIALDYIKWKYKYPSGLDALKKIILLQRDPLKLGETFIKDYHSRHYKKVR